MSVFEPLWTKIERFAEVLEVVDDLSADYMFSLGKRLDKLERGMKHLERKLHSHPYTAGIQQETIAQIPLHAH